jgi:hypothetical protein
MNFHPINATHRFYPSWSIAQDQLASCRAVTFLPRSWMIDDRSASGIRERAKGRPPPRGTIIVTGQGTRTPMAGLHERGGVGRASPSSNNVICRGIAPRKAIMAWLQSPFFDAVMASAWLVLGGVSVYAVREGKAGPGLLLIPIAFSSLYIVKLLWHGRGRWHRAMGRSSVSRAFQTGLRK